ncbi:hypothetical protein J6590_106310, partial [Homalodisca vitripennis]
VEGNQTKEPLAKRKKRSYSAHMNGRTPNYQRPKIQPLPPRVRPHVSGPAGWGKPAGGTPDPAVPVSLTALVGRVPPHRRTRARPDRPRSRQGGTPAPTPPTARERTPFAADEPH